MSKAQFEAARELISQKKYVQARNLLMDIDHPKAQEWLEKVNALMIYDTPSEDPQQTAARMKSYTMHLVLVIVLYFVLFLPGFIANLLFYSEGKRMEQIAGNKLPGVTGLNIMRFIGLTLLAIILLLVIAPFIFRATSGVF